MDHEKYKFFNYSSVAFSARKANFVKNRVNYHLINIIYMMPTFVQKINRKRKKE